MSGVQQRQVESDEDGMRLDRWFAHHFPQLGFGRLQKLIRNGEVKVDKAKVTTSTRVSAGQTPSSSPPSTRKSTDWSRASSAPQIWMRVSAPAGRATATSPRRTRSSGGR